MRAPRAPGSARGRRVRAKPLRIIAGLIISFSFFTLFATWILDKLGLPDDLLRNLAIGFLFVMAAVLLVPQLALVVERALASFTRLRPANAGGGYVLGITLGLVFVPCAGPFLGAISAAAANQNFGVPTIAATLAYAAGAGVPMLAIAYGGRGAAARIRARAPQVRMVSGVLVAGVALALVFHLDDHLTSSRPRPDRAREQDRELRPPARSSLEGPRRPRAALLVVHTKADGLPDYGIAPPLKPDGVWINSKPFTLASAPREGRARGLLDVLVHQLPAHASAPQVLVRGIPQDGASSSSACTRRSSHSSTSRRMSAPQ